MGQLTIYLDAKTEEKLKEAVRQSGQSTSGWISSLINEKTKSAWSPEVLALAGSWKDDDFPEPEELRRMIESGTDVPREEFD